MAQVPALGGTDPLTFWLAGSGSKGRRKPGEMPSLPDRDALSPIGQRAQTVLLELVGGGQGRLQPSGPIPTDHLELLSELMAEWVDHYGINDGDYVTFRTRGCGGWYLLDRLVPLQNPNRWDSLRAGLYEHLRSVHGWTGVGKGPRFNVYQVPHEFIRRW